MTRTFFRREPGMDKQRRRREKAIPEFARCRQAAGLARKAWKGEVCRRAPAHACRRAPAHAALRGDTVATLTFSPQRVSLASGRNASRWVRYGSATKGEHFAI
jgi:hypothetical protein